MYKIFFHLLPRSDGKVFRRSYLGSDTAETASESLSVRIWELLPPDPAKRNPIDVPIVDEKELHFPGVPPFELRSGIVRQEQRSETGHVIRDLS